MRPATWFVVPGDAHTHEETWHLHDMTEQELMDILEVVQTHPSFRFLRSSSGLKTTSPTAMQPCCHYQWLKISNIFQFLSIITLSIATSSSSTVAAAIPLSDDDGLQPSAPPKTTTTRTARRKQSNQKDNTTQNSSINSTVPNSQSNSQPNSLTLVARSISASIVPAFVPLPMGALLAVLFFWVPFPDWYTANHIHTFSDSLPLDVLVSHWSNSSPSHFHTTFSYITIKTLR